MPQFIPSVSGRKRRFHHCQEALRRRTAILLPAWHAGISYWAGETNVNTRSVGIELVNPGHEFGYVPFAEPQIAALLDLAQAILARHPIPISTNMTPTCVKEA